jgi:nitroimidazol reductase NimA-like FMN-containing flavoprotein (pyridoxamine 5'-phosphate oxidase superfamily)
VDNEAYVEVLGHAECMRLLPSVPVGWLAYCDADAPVLVPVNFAVDGDEIVVRSSFGGKLAAAARGKVMALAVDSLDPENRTGWSVVVRGRARIVEDTDDDAGPWLARPAPWAPGDKELAIALRAAEVTGRRLARPGVAP